MAVFGRGAWDGGRPGDGPSDGLRPSRVTKEEGSACNLEPQILPIGILLFYRIDLVLAAIGLEGFLSAYRGGNLFVHFIPDEMRAAPFLGEAFKQAFAMLPNALDEV